MNEAQEKELKESFMMSLCFAGQKLDFLTGQEIRMILEFFHSKYETLLTKNREEFAHKIYQVVNNVAWCDLENGKGEYICKSELLREIDVLKLLN